MLEKRDAFYLQLEEPVSSCLLALRKIILSQHQGIKEEWKYGMPFFYYNRKMLCYLWVQKKTNKPYIGLADGNKINHPELIAEKRKRMKIMLFDAGKNLPLKKIQKIIELAIEVIENTSRN